MGAAFGGGASQTLFGSTGASTFLGKATTAAAVLFMLTSLTLAYMSSHQDSGSVVSDIKPPAAQTAPAPETNIPATPATAPAAQPEKTE